MATEQSSRQDSQVQQLVKHIAEKHATATSKADIITNKTRLEYYAKKQTSVSEIGGLFVKLNT